MPELTMHLSQLDIEPFEVIASPERRELSLEELMADGMGSVSQIGASPIPDFSSCHTCTCNEPCFCVNCAYCKGCAS